MERTRPHVKVGSSHDAAVRRGNSRVPGAGQHERSEVVRCIASGTRNNSFVARIERSEMREPSAPDFASLNRGYDLSHRVKQLMARHVGVAALPVKNRPETGKANRRSLPTATGWSLVLTKDRRPCRRP